MSDTYTRRIGTCSTLTLAMTLKVNNSERSLPFEVQDQPPTSCRYPLTHNRSTWNVVYKSNMYLPALSVYLHVGTWQPEWVPTYLTFRRASRPSLYLLMYRHIRGVRLRLNNNYSPFSGNYLDVCRHHNSLLGRNFFIIYLSGYPPRPVAHILCRSPNIWRHPAELRILTLSSSNNTTIKS